MVIIEGERGVKVVAVPRARPETIISGVRSFIGDEKLGSVMGARNSQFVRAPPEIAIRERMITLLI